MQITKIKSLLIITLLSTNAAATPVKIYSINSEEIQKVTKTADTNTLVIIGVDNTVTIPKAKMFLPNSNQKNFINSLILNSLKSTYYNQAIINWYLQRKLKLVEPSWPNFISDLKSKGATVVGVEELNKILYSSIKEPEIWKFNELASLKISFTPKIGNKGLFQISQIKAGQSVFYNGIIFTGPFAKAETIVQFLKVSNLMPRKIIVIDSRSDQIDQIDYALRKFDIDYYSFDYKATTQIQEKADENVAHLQQQTLIEKGKWLEDEEAQRILNNKN